MAQTLRERAQEAVKRTQRYPGQASGRDFGELVGVGREQGKNILVIHFRRVEGSEGRARWGHASKGILVCLVSFIFLQADSIYVLLVLLEINFEKEAKGT